MVWPFDSITQTILERTYVIAGGYTAGHLTPGLAVAEEFRQRHPSADILVAGWANPVEEAFVRRSGLSFLPLPASPWSSQGLPTRCRSLVRLIPAVRQARREFRKVGAIGLLSLGSFASFAPAVAARSLGIPVTVFEPNATFGLASRLIVPFAKQVLVSKLFAAAHLPREVPGEVTGVPLRSAFSALPEPAPKAPSARAHLLVEGGSLGNPFFNRQIPNLAGRLKTAGLDFRITHQCGRDVDPTPIRIAYHDRKVDATVEPFIDPISPLMASANLVLTSAGAITLHEIAATGIPPVVTPLRLGAAAHQYANAEIFGRSTGCLVRPEESWDDDEVAAAITGLLNEPAAWQTQSTRLRAFSDPGAREAIVRRLTTVISEPFDPS